MPSTRSVGVFTQTLLSIGFVHFIVAFEPVRLTVTFECQNVRRDAVKEPAIVADDNRTTTK